MKKIRATVTIQVEYEVDERHYFKAGALPTDHDELMDTILETDRDHFNRKPDEIFFTGGDTDRIIYVDMEEVND